MTIQHVSDQKKFKDAQEVILFLKKTFEFTWVTLYVENVDIDREDESKKTLIIKWNVKS